MTKKLNSFKNIISVLLALLLLGIAAGPAAAVVGTNATAVAVTSSAVANASNAINISFITGNATLGNWSVNITNPLSTSGSQLGSTWINISSANLTPQLSVIGGNSTLLRSGMFNSDNGIINVLLNTSNATDPNTFNVTFKNNDNTSENVTVTGLSFVAGPIATITVSNISTSAVANNSNKFAMNVSASDAQNNPIRGATISLLSNRTQDTIAPTSVTTNATTGAVALFNVTSTLSGQANITGTSGSVSGSNLNGVFVAGPASKLAFFGPNSAVTVPTPGTTTQTIAVQDAFGNNVTSGIPGTLVTLTKTGSATFSPATLIITNVNITGNVTANGISTSGIFNSSVFVNDTVVETTTIGASPNATFSAISKDIQFFGPVTKLAVTLSKSTLYANSSDTLLVTAQLQDAANNSITTAGISVTLTANNASLFTIASPTNTTDANGVTTFTVTANGLAGSTAFRAIDTSGNYGDSSTVTLNQAPHITNSAVTNSTAVILTGANSTITATIKDYSNTVISGQAVTFNITTGDATFTDGTKLITLSTNSTGIATAAVTSTNASTPVISVNVTIVDEVGVKRQIGDLQNFTVSPSAASQFAFSPSANIGLKNVAGTAQVINITVKDVAGNLNNTADGVINITTSNTALGNMSNGTTVTNNLSVTMTDGNATFTYTVNSSDEGVAVLTLNESSLGIVGTITITTSGAKGIALTVNTSSPQINGWVSAYVQLTDVSGAALSISGTNISFNVKNAANVIQSVSTNATNESGIAIFNFTQSVGGVYTVTASSSTMSNSTTVTFAGAEASIVVTSNISAPAVNQTVTINATVKDANGVTSGNLNGQNITFLADGVIFGTPVAISNGIASTTYTKATAGTVTITAFYNATLQGSKNVTFGGAAQVLTNITVSPASASVMVNGTTNFTAVAKDQTNTVMTGITYTWASSNTTVGTISSTGVFTASAVVGTTTITASSNGVTSNLVTVTVTATNPLPAPVAAWDADNSGTIEKSEAVAAVRDYLHGGGTSKADAVAVVRAYLHP
ncbi:MAG: hypothetical protein WA144_14220 [Candidatus Methanoperedens sp.]